MKALTRIFALAICLILAIGCFTGCHEKGEIAVTIGDVEFTSGYYACALVFSDSEARSKVEDALSEKGALPEEIDYWEQKVENKDYEQWVRDDALLTLKNIAAVKTLSAKDKYTLDAETKSVSENESEYLWESYGYKDLLEQNGVSEQTFKEYMLDSYLMDKYFEFVYGKGGKKEISADTLSKYLADNYVLTNKLEVSFSSLKDEQKTDKKEQFANFEKALKDGTKTFEDVYLEYNEIKKEDHKHEEAKEDEILPKDQHATVIGNEGTGYASEHFETAKKMAVGEVKVITLEENAGLVLLVRKDISADPYYIETFDLMLREELEGENYSDEIEKYGKSLDCTVNDFSIDQFDIEEIVYPKIAY